jgi:hypothetical protein
MKQLNNRPNFIALNNENKYYVQITDFNSSIINAQPKSN